MSGPLLGRDLGVAGDGRGGVEADGGDSLGYSHHMQLPARDKPGPSWSGYLRCTELRGGAAYLYLISILIWPHFDTYPYVSIQNILMRAQNILITKIYL